MSRSEGNKVSKVYWFSRVMARVFSKPGRVGGRESKLNGQGLDFSCSPGPGLGSG